MPLEAALATLQVLEDRKGQQMSMEMISIGGLVLMHIVGVISWAIRVEKRLQALEYRSTGFEARLDKIDNVLERVDQKLDDLKEMILRNAR